MVWKQMGLMDILKNNRFLHDKEVLARTVDAMVVSIMKDDLIDGSIIYQVWELSGHYID